MDTPTKLPLVKKALRLLVDRLGRTDRIGMVVYAGYSGVALKPMRCTPRRKPAILEAIEQLDAGGSTHGSAGIETAYRLARDGFMKGGTNRVILATDGDFNVGVTDRKSLVRLIEKEAESGVFLTVLGFGTGNLKDATMEQLADKGNGNYAYIDSISEARKRLVHEMGATLVTIAKDVKIQVEFNPARVAAYRLIGYENRMLRAEDFNDDKKDAGEIGAGHRVTALYEAIPVGVATDLPDVDPLRYQPSGTPGDASEPGEMLALKLRYKRPKADESQLIATTVHDSGQSLDAAGEDFRFAVAVAGFGMLLRGSESCGDLSYDDVIELAQGSRGLDEYGYRAEFVNLVRNAQALAPADP